MKQRYVLIRSLLSQSNSPQRKYKNQNQVKVNLGDGNFRILEGKVNLNTLVLKTGRSFFRD